ncbi:hypothetical protein H5410_052078 [Solanum commersonii]|uniref:Uncharacterized protein n=1 Tax=Solanum commersonii TaxID=4109 RepID=A0A9J5X065_SOLCO|nr:hypothetical protein H5410_052078 [Solanum commersonii]
MRTRNRARSTDQSQSFGDQVMPTNTVKVPESSFPQLARTTTSEVDCSISHQGTIVTNSSSQELLTVTRIRDFLRMNPPVFMGSKVEGDP